jgi:hypothetical protein
MMEVKRPRNHIVAALESYIDSKNVIVAKE